MWQTDQRKTKRFDLQLPVEVIKVGASLLKGPAETHNLSSGGALIVSSTPAQVGDFIEYRIALPHDPKENKSLGLHCVGKVVRTEGAPAENNFRFAATLERYEFVRTSL